MTVSPRYLERTDHANGSSPVLNLGRPVERPDETRARKENCWLIRFRQIAARDLDSRRETKRNLRPFCAASSNPSLRFTVTVIPWFLETNCCHFFFSLEIAGYYYTVFDRNYRGLLWAFILYFSYSSFPLFRRRDWKFLSPSYIILTLETIVPHVSMNFLQLTSKRFRACA